MAKSNKTLEIDFDYFEGICLSKCHSGKKSVADIVNFHITDDGSLKKRCGYRHLLNSGTKKIHSIWSGKIKGKFICYVLFDNIVYLLNFEEKETRYIGALISPGKYSSFFCYKDNLYIKDTDYFYLVTEYYLKRITGYVPLYGKDWPTTKPGEIYQPLNLMNHYARISYKVTVPYTNLLPVVHPVSSIVSVYRNGTLLDSSEYYFDSLLNTININSKISEGQTYLVTVLFDSSSEPTNAQLEECDMVATFGKISDFRAFAWSTRTKSSNIYVSSRISEEDHAASEAVLPDCGDLYFKKENSFSVAGGNNFVTSVSRHYDRLLIFTDGDAWMANAAMEGDGLPVININSTAGCATQKSNTMAGNDPVTVSKNCIVRWRSNTDEVNEFNAYSISDDINQKLDASFFSNAIVYKNIYTNELWFTDTTGDGTIWIYNINKGSWVRFLCEKEILGMFDANGNIGFYTINDIFIFDESLNVDVAQDGTATEIVSSFESGILDLGSANSKRLTSGEIMGDMCGSSTTVSVNCDNGEHISFDCQDSSEHSIEKRRLHSGRFKTIKLSLTAKGDTNQVIHSIKIKAKEKINK